MPSNTILATAIISFLGFLINGTVMFLVLVRGREKYHYLFAGALLMCALWDIGIFLLMIRNDFLDEIPIYGYVSWYPATFLPALFYHFTCSYLNLPKKWSLIFIWTYCIGAFVLCVFGIFGKITGIYYYSWANIYRLDSRMLNAQVLGFIPLFYIFVWYSCWLFFRAYKRETSPVKKRHIIYILISLFVISLALVKVATLHGIDNPYLLPIGILLTAVFGALIGIAIIKYRLLDITVIIKKTTIYSVLLGLIVFIFSFSEHMLATYVGGIFVQHSIFMHLLSIAIVIGVLVPIRQKIEHIIERFFEKKKVEF